MDHLEHEVVELPNSELDILEDRPSFIFNKEKREQNNDSEAGVKLWIIKYLSGERLSDKSL